MTNSREFDDATTELRRVVTAATRAFIADAVHEALAPETEALRGELSALRQQFAAFDTLRPELTQTQHSLEQLASQVADLAAMVDRLELKVDRGLLAETENAALRQALKQQSHWPWQRRKDHVAGRNGDYGQDA